MHAVVGTVSMDREHFEAQQEFLHDVILPNLRERPGFVAGYWMYDDAAALGRVTIVFTSEEAARSFWRVTAGSTDHRREIGLSFTDLHLLKVLAHATA